MPNLNVTSTTPSTYSTTTIAFDSAKGYGLKTTYSGGASVGARRYEVRQSTNTPGFHNPSRTGRLLANDFLYTLERDIAPYGRTVTASKYDTKQTSSDYIYRVQEGCFSLQGTWDGYSNSDNPIGVYFNTRPDEGVLDGQARNALLSKIKGTNVNVAVATAEAGKTMNMVGNTAIRIAGAMRNLRRGNFSDAARDLGVASRKRAASRFNKAFVKDQTQAVASGWLALQYGWKPLLDDVYGSVKELNGAANQGFVSTAKVRKRKTTNLQFVKKTTSSSKTFLITQTGVAQTDVSYSVTFIRRLGAQQDLPRLGITNPALVAWELVPYSFVVDWFLPIGNWLENLDATLGCDFLTGSKTVFYRMQVVQYDTSSDTESLSGKFVQSSRTVVYNRRTRLTEFPSVAVPHFKNPLSALHMANGLALLTNLS